MTEAYIKVKDLVAKVIESMNYNPHTNPLQRQNHVAEHRHFITMVERMASDDPLRNKIKEAEKVEIIYPGQHETKYAVVRYAWRTGNPFKIASYYIYGEELKSGRPLICWHWRSSMNFDVVEDNFSTEEEAKARCKELRRLRNESK